MHRRSLLAGIGVASSATVAGYLSLESTVAQESTTPEPPSDPDDPIARAVLGAPSDEQPPHRLRLWNLADERQSIGLEIESETSTFNGSYDLDPDAHVIVVIHDRDEYDVTVTVDDTTVGSTTIEAASFDDPCPATELFVLEDAEFEMTMASDSDLC